MVMGLIRNLERMQRDYSSTGFEFEDQLPYELSMILGVLIHINPNELPIMYKKLYNSSKRWRLI